MTTFKTLPTLFCAAALFALGGCGQNDNQGQMDDSGVSDTAPTPDTTTAPGSASDPYATGQGEDTMTTPQSDDMSGGDPTGSGSNIDPNTGAPVDPSGTSSGDTTESGSTTPEQ